MSPTNFYSQIYIKNVINRNKMYKSLVNYVQKAYKFFFKFIFLNLLIRVLYYFVLYKLCFVINKIICNNFIFYILE